VKTNLRQRAFFSAAKNCLVTVGLSIIIATGVAAQTNTFPSSGNVGIGTTSPGSKLDISSGKISVQPAASGQFMLINDPTWGNAGSFETTSAGDIHLKAYSAAFATPQLFLKNGGNVGIGTTSPSYHVHVNGSGIQTIAVESTQNGNNAQFAFIGKTAAGSSQSWLLGENLATTGGAFEIYDNTAAQNRFFINTSGNVGIGTTNPQNKLHVAGSITVDGNINAKYQDVAEWVPSSEQFAAGTVVVLDTTKSNQVVSSTTAYDTRVAGVISAQPGITLGEKSDDKVPVATTGRVRVKVDASLAPINIGDLLVTSNIPGVAMKSEPVSLGGILLHRPGTIIGKALEPLAKGNGEILVLLSLQ
jgi:hypothetical protein